MKYETNPPDAASLMLSARSFGNYDLPGALADLIDGVEMIGGAAFNDLAVEADAVVSF